MQLKKVRFFSRVAPIPFIVYCRREAHRGVFYCAGHFPPNIQADLRALRDKLSLSEDATLNWKDFLAGTIDKTLAMREDNIRMVFDHFKHGAEADHLKYDDVVEIFGGEAQAQEIMQFLDSDKDGVISFEDFRKAVEESMAEDLDDEEC